MNQLPVINQPVAGRWAHGLCDTCYDCGNCCLAYWCHCVVAGKNGEALGLGSCVGQGCLSMLYCCCIHIVCGIRQREETRKQYNIQGDGCSDCCSVCCCYCCTQIQIMNTIAEYENANRTTQIVSITNPNFQPIIAQPVQVISQTVQPGIQGAPQQHPQQLLIANQAIPQSNLVPVMEPPRYEDVEKGEKYNT